MTTQEMQAAAAAIGARYGYEVEIKAQGAALSRCKVRHTFGPWQPEVYAVEDWSTPGAGGCITDLEVQTTSYGALEVQELRCMITGLESAMAMVTELNVLFGLAV
jgi:hypothetical protein